MKKTAKAKDAESKKKNMQRLGGKGGGLSLEAFANAKTKSNNYNPAIIKKQRELYKNAKYVSKYKRILKQQGEPATQLEDKHDIDKVVDTKNNNKKKKKISARGLREVYERKREEEDRARMETEAAILARNEERQRAEARRKELRGKMLKKTKSGQPVMKYRIEHILETLQGSKG